MCRYLVKHLRLQYFNSEITVQIFLSSGEHGENILTISSVKLRFQTLTAGSRNNENLFLRITNMLPHPPLRAKKTCHLSKLANLHPLLIQYENLLLIQNNKIILRIHTHTIQSHNHTYSQFRTPDSPDQSLNCGGKQRPWRKPTPA